MDWLLEVTSHLRHGLWKTCDRKGKLVIRLNGFQKKSQKTPKKELERALKLKQQYYESKK